MSSRSSEDELNKLRLGGYLYGSGLFLVLATGYAVLDVFVFPSNKLVNYDATTIIAAAGMVWMARSFGLLMQHRRRSET